METHFFFDIFRWGLIVNVVMHPQNNVIESVLNYDAQCVRAL